MHRSLQRDLPLRTSQETPALHNLMENCIADTVGQMKNKQTGHQAHSAAATYFLTLILACDITVLIKVIMVR